MKKDFVLIPDGTMSGLGLMLIPNNSLADLKVYKSDILGVIPENLRTLANGLLDAADKLEAGTLFDEKEKNEADEWYENLGKDKDMLKSKPVCGDGKGEVYYQQDVCPAPTRGIKIETVSYDGVVFDRRK